MRVLFCPPDHFDVVDVKNPHMLHQRIDRERAIAQWRAMCEAFERADCAIDFIHPVPGIEDMVFCANQSFVGVDQNGTYYMAPSRMRHFSRQREVAHFIEWFLSRGYEIVRLDFGDDFLEGHGDLLWRPETTGGNERQKEVWAGYGFRSTRGGVDKIATVIRERGAEVYPLQLMNERFYHLDTCFAPLGPDAVLIYSGAFTTGGLDSINNHWERVYEAPESEAMKFICNGVYVNCKFLTPALTPTIERACQGEGIEPIVLDTSEFEKSGGSIFCMKQFV